MTEATQCPVNDQHKLVDPDPLSLFLTWLGAVGSVASLVALYDQREQAREQQRLWDLTETALGEVTEHMSQIESGLALLDGQIGKMSILLQMAQAGTANGIPMLTPQSLAQASFRFGSVRLNLPDHLLKEWARFHRETSVITKRVGASMHSLLKVLSDHRFRVMPETYHQLIEFRRHLNSVLESGSYVAAVAACQETIASGREAMASVRSDFRG
jgi:hypothetical protein